MKCGVRSAECVRTGKVLFLVVCFLITMVCSLPPVKAAEKWPGVDESVVEKYAMQQGRDAHEPLINTDQGDLLLFVFLMAGAIGGFAAGYYWRILITEKAQPPAGERQQVSNLTSRRADRLS